MTDARVERAASYYAARLEAFGPTPRGVDWNSAESQALRFGELLRVGEAESALDVNDYGCGYGALVDYLADVDGRPFTYAGYDAADTMIEAARQRYAGRGNCTFTSARAACVVRDYTVASGIFNVKLDADPADWWAYVQEVLDDLASLSRKGFAFNVLTGYSDADKRRADLFYADPAVILDHCVRRFSRRVAILHDYPLYEFTALVRLQE